MGGEVLGGIFSIFKSDFFDELADMQHFLKTVSYNDWYPVEKLNTCLEHVRTKDTKLLNDIGRTWGERGYEAIGGANATPKELVLAVFSQYKQQHKGSVNEVGTVICKEDPDHANKVLVSDYTPYRCDIVLHMFLSILEKAGARNIQHKHPPEECQSNGFACCRYEITWD